MAIVEFVSWTATMVQGAIALVAVTKLFLETMAALSKGDDVDNNVIKLGRIVPKFMQACLKFLGAGNYLSNPYTYII